MPELSFRDFLETYAQQECATGEFPTAIIRNAEAAELRTWLELEERLKASGANDEVFRAGKQIWRRYRVARRSSLA